VSTLNCSGTERTGGAIRRMCPDCAVEVEIGRPGLVINAESSKAQRNEFCKALRRQVLWPALCPVCRDWWNQTIRRVLDRPGQTEAS
jgi:hypothetical protein